MFMTDATFVTILCDGKEVMVDCQVNLKTKEVFDIHFEDAKIPAIIDRECVIIDGRRYTVSPDGDEEYWYR